MAVVQWRECLGDSRQTVRVRATSFKVWESFELDAATFLVEFWGRRRPVVLTCGQVDLADHEVDDAVEQVDLVLDVVVQRHRIHAKAPAELAHAQGIDASLVSQRQCGTQHPLPGQSLSFPAGRIIAFGLISIVWFAWLGIAMLSNRSGLRAADHQHAVAH